MSEAAALRRRYAEQLRQDGVLSRVDLANAFAAVPREVFLADGFYGRDGAQLTPADRDFLAAVYRDEALVTKLVDGTPVSSSSQPSLMATMIEALDLAPGARVLEIGVGTGYNAALMAAIEADVTSLDVQPDVAARAVVALTRAGYTVDVRVGDGYLGDPTGRPHDRVIVTVGVAGISPYWLDQLTPDGFVLAPTGHAGNHPVLRVWRRPDGAVSGQAVTPAGFMTASGPLSARYPGAHPEPVRGPFLPAPTVRHPPAWRSPLGAHRYHDLWFSVGAWDRRVTFASMEGAAGAGGCTLLDEAGLGGATITIDGSVLGCGPQARRYADEALALRDRWIREGGPGVRDWWTELTLAGDPDQPIWVPGRWTLRCRGDGR